MAVLNEFKNANNVSSFAAIIDNLSKVEFKMSEESTMKITDFVNISLLKNSNFKLENEFKTYKTIVRALLDKKDKDGNVVEKTLIERIMETGPQCIKDLSNEQIDNILTPIGNSDLLKPSYDYLIGFINKAVMESVGSEVGTMFDNFEINTTGLTQDQIEEQNEQIIEVIQDAKDLMDSFNNSEKDLNTIIAENQEELTRLLENLQDNANLTHDQGQNVGALKEVYDAVLNYVSDEANGLADIQTIIENNTNNGEIDWAAVIAEYVQE